MYVIINETGERKTLLLIDPASGVNWIRDFIGNECALTDGQFTWDDENDAYRVSQENYEWWANVVAETQDAENRIAKLKEAYGDDDVDRALLDVRIGHYDIDQRPAAIQEALDASFTLCQCPCCDGACGNLGDQQNDDGEWVCSECADPIIPDDSWADPICSHMTKDWTCCHECGETIQWGRIDTSDRTMGNYRRGACACGDEAWTEMIIGDRCSRYGYEKFEGEP